MNEDNFRNLNWHRKAAVERLITSCNIRPLIPWLRRPTHRESNKWSLNLQVTNDFNRTKNEYRKCELINNVSIKSNPVMPVIETLSFPQLEPQSQEQTYLIKN